MGQAVGLTGQAMTPEMQAMGTEIPQVGQPVAPALANSPEQVQY